MVHGTDCENIPLKKNLSTVCPPHKTQSALISFLSFLVRRSINVYQNSLEGCVVFLSHVSLGGGWLELS
jgi:hypothetical protein